MQWTLLVLVRTDASDFIPHPPPLVEGWSVQRRVFADQEVCTKVRERLQQELAAEGKDPLLLAVVEVPLLYAMNTPALRFYGAEESQPPSGTLVPKEAILATASYYDVLARKARNTGQAELQAAMEDEATYYRNMTKSSGVRYYGGRLAHVALGRNA